MAKGIDALEIVMAFHWVDGRKMFYKKWWTGFVYYSSC
jgi:hypothetical protein